VGEEAGEGVGVKKGGREKRVLIRGPLQTLCRTNHSSRALLSRFFIGPLPPDLFCLAGFFSIKTLEMGSSAMLGLCDKLLIFILSPCSRLRNASSLRKCFFPLFYYDLVTEHSSLNVLHKNEPFLNCV
jgi:hypothetical protein